MKWQSQAIVFTTTISLCCPIFTTTAMANTQADSTGHINNSSSQKVVNISSQPWTNDQAKLDQMEIDGASVARITSADSNGFTAKFSNIEKFVDEDDSLVAFNRDGEQVVKLNKTLPLKDGTSIPVTYEINGNQVHATYEQPINLEQIQFSAISTRDAGGCALGALGVVSGAALGAAAIISSPVTGPVGPLVAFGTVTGLGAGIGQTGRECTE